MRRFTFLAIIVLAFTIASCGDASPTVVPTPLATIVTTLNNVTAEPAQSSATSIITLPTATVTPTLDAAKLFDEAVANTRNLNSYHMAFAIVNKGSTSKIEGDFSKDNAHYTFTSPGNNIEVINIGSDSYTSLNSGAYWLKQTFDKNTDVAQDSIGLVNRDGYSSKGKAIQVVGNEDLAGTPTTHLLFQGPLIGAGFSSNADFWIVHDPSVGNVILKFHVKSSDTNAHSDITMTYSNFNKPLSIQPPENYLAGGSGPTATPAGQAVISVTQHINYRVGKTLYFAGIVKNNGSVAVGSIKVTLTLFDANGGVVGTGSDFILSNVVLNPAQQVGFQIIVDTPPDKWAKEDLQPTADAISSSFSSTAPGLSITGDAIAVGQYSAYVVRGLIKNSDTKSADLVSVIVTAYDASNKLVEVESAFAEPFSIAAGKTGNFTANFLRSDVKIKRYELFINGVQGK